MLRLFKNLPHAQRLSSVAEMQVLVTELISKFHFSIPPEGDTFKLLPAGLLVPAGECGEKSVRLCVERVEA